MTTAPTTTLSGGVWTARTAHHRRPLIVEAARYLGELIAVAAFFEAIYFGLIVAYAGFIA